jgi:hypothetical protein
MIIFSASLLLVIVARSYHLQLLIRLFLNYSQPVRFHCYYHCRCCFAAFVVFACPRPVGSGKPSIIATELISAKCSFGSIHGQAPEIAACRKNGKKKPEARSFGFNPPLGGVVEETNECYLKNWCSARKTMDLICIN